MENQELARWKIEEGFFSFSEMDPKDTLRISIVLKTVYIQTYATEGVTTDFAEFIDHRFSQENIAKSIREKNSRYFVGYYKNNPIGVAEVILQTQCPLRKIPVMEVSKLYVLEKFIGKGIGFGLMKLVEEELIHADLKELNIAVYSGNTRAISFYERQGYESLGMIDFVLKDKIYENCLMNKKLG